MGKMSMSERAVQRWQCPFDGGRRLFHVSSLLDNAYLIRNPGGARSLQVSLVCT